MCVQLARIILPRKVLPSIASIYHHKVTHRRRISAAIEVSRKIMEIHDEKTPQLYLRRNSFQFTLILQFHDFGLLKAYYGIQQGNSDI